MTRPPSCTNHHPVSRLGLARSHGPAPSDQATNGSPAPSLRCVDGGYSGPRLEERRSARETLPCAGAPQSARPSFCRRRLADLSRHSPRLVARRCPSCNSPPHASTDCSIVTGRPRRPPARWPVRDTGRQKPRSRCRSPSRSRSSLAGGAPGVHQDAFFVSVATSPSAISSGLPWELLAESVGPRWGVLPMSGELCRRNVSWHGD